MGIRVVEGSAGRDVQFKDIRAILSIPGQSILITKDLRVIGSFKGIPGSLT